MKEHHRIWKIIYYDKDLQKLRTCYTFHISKNFYLCFYDRTKNKTILVKQEDLFDCKEVFDENN